MATEINDKIDVEGRAFEVAEQLADSPEEEQWFFPPIRDAMMEAYEARSLRRRILRILRRFRSPG